MPSASAALERLVDGNRRFAADAPSRAMLTDSARRSALAAGQAPFATILGCSDSRVPVELVFDQGLGDLFVIRVAGNISAPALIGSVEFAAEAFGTRLVVVLGHQRCGAVTATLEALQRPPAAQSPHLGSIVDLIRPAVAPLLEQTDWPTGQEALLAAAVRANIRMAVEQLRHGSPLVQQLITEAGLRVVGAEYSLETGLVEFLDDLS
ncbi:MAG: carbonic anhydrase [Anaerolineales bacterium]|nr:carbonic anhydrase [Anaerolineales bacterium]